MNDKIINLLPNMTHEELNQFYNHYDNDVTKEKLNSVINKNIIICQKINDKNEYIELIGKLLLVEDNSIVLLLEEDAELEVPINEVMKMQILPDKVINDIVVNKVYEITNIYDDCITCYITGIDEKEIELIYKKDDDARYSYYPVNLIKQIKEVQNG